MKSILVIGIGRFGRRVTRRLSGMDVEVMAVDIVEERAETVAPYAAKILVGDAANAEFLKSLGVRNFDVCIVAIGDNFLASLEVTSLLKELGAKRVISRAARDTQEKFLLRNGADTFYMDIQCAAIIKLEAVRSIDLSNTIASDKLMIDTGRHNISVEIRSRDLAFGAGNQLSASVVLIILSAECCCASCKSYFKLFL